MYLLQVRYISIFVMFDTSSMFTDVHFVPYST